MAELKEILRELRLLLTQLPSDRFYVLALLALLALGVVFGKQLI